MTQEEKDLLLKDLCARLPYGIIVRGIFINYSTDKGKILYEECDKRLNYQDLNRYESLKPYLRPLSSITEEELMEINSNILGKGQKLEVNGQFFELIFKQDHCYTLYLAGGIMLWIIEYLTSRHFDYNGLIQMGLALEAPEGMYKLEE